MIRHIKNLLLQKYGGGKRTCHRLSQSDIEFQSKTNFMRSIIAKRRFRQGGISYINSPTTFNIVIDAVIRAYEK
jgi:hypothetical protein